jgi:hypothetical protein
MYAAYGTKRRVEVSALRRPICLALAAVSLALIAGGGLALASGRVVTVEVKGYYGERYQTICGKTHEDFKLFHRTQTIGAEGLVVPAPSKSFKVRLEIKRCIKGVFVKLGDRFTKGQAGSGEFKGFFKAGPLAPKSHRHGAIVYDRVRAIVGTAYSDYDYFAVTN